LVQLHQLDFFSFHSSHSKTVDQQRSKLREHACRTHAWGTEVPRQSELSLNLRRNKCQKARSIHHEGTSINGDASIFLIAACGSVEGLVWA
jgi:hypothetical protein